MGHERDAPRRLHQYCLDEPTVHDHYELFGLDLRVRRGSAALARLPTTFPEQLGVIQTQFKWATMAEEHHDPSIAFHGLIVKGVSSPASTWRCEPCPHLVPGQFLRRGSRGGGGGESGLGRHFTRAMKQGDGDKASAEYVKMMRNVGNKVAQLFRQRSLFESVEVTA